MKKILAVVILSSLLLGGCLPAGFLPQTQPQKPQPRATNTSAILSLQDLVATGTAIAALTLQAMPTASPTPSATLEIPTNTLDPNSFILTLGAATAAPAETDTPNPVMLTLGAATAAPMDTSTPSPTAAVKNNTSTPISGPIQVGSIPANLPKGFITISNRSKVQAYISLHFLMSGGREAYFEYPFNKISFSLFKDKIPAGKYNYVLWVGGREFIGSFSLGVSQDLSINIFKDHVVIN
jgi:hypothetical protein